MPYAGRSWQAEGAPARLPSEYLPNGTAKLLTLFHPATGRLRAKGVLQATNAVLHPWLQQELSAILAALPPREATPDSTTLRSTWARWLTDTSDPGAIPTTYPPVRLLLILDNLAGHKSPWFVRWCTQQGIVLLDTPLGGSWLNMAESIQGLIKRRALDGQSPTEPQHIIDWLEATVAGWNRHPTPFVWGGKRTTRRLRARVRRQAAGGSGALFRRPIRQRPARHLTADTRAK